MEQAGPVPVGMEGHVEGRLAVLRERELSETCFSRLGVVSRGCDAARYVNVDWLTLGLADLMSTFDPPLLESFSRLIPSASTMLGSIFHKVRVLCAKRTSLLACFSPKSTDSRFLTVIRSRAVTSSLTDVN